MGFTVFLSYGNDPEEQIIALRLQTLAAAYGISVLVPARGEIDVRTNTRVAGPLAEVRRMIDRSDCVLAIATTEIGHAARAEISYALTRRKIIIPILREGISLSPPLTELPVFRFTPWNTGQVESQVVDFLKRQKLSQQNQQTIGALVAIGLGLFLWAALAEK